MMYGIYQCIQNGFVWCWFEFGFDKVVFGVIEYFYFIWGQLQIGMVIKCDYWIEMFVMFSFNCCVVVECLCSFQLDFVIRVEIQ